MKKNKFLEFINKNLKTPTQFRFFILFLFVFILACLMVVGAVETINSLELASVSDVNIIKTDKEQDLNRVEDVFYHDLDGDGFEEKIIRTSDDSWYHKFSFFKHGKFLGDIEFDVQKYDLIPEFRIVNSERGETWFIIKAMASTGTGLILFEEYWYTISDKGIKRVLEYPVYGHIVVGIELDRAFKSEIISQVPVSNAYAFDIRFEAAYATAFHREDSEEKDCDGFYNSEEFLECKFEFFKKDSNLFNLNKRVRYVWNREEEIFTIDENNSNTTQDQINRFWSGGADEFLKDNFKEIIRLARTGNNDQKNRVKMLLEECKDTWEKINLLALFSGDEPYVGEEVVYYGSLFRWSTSGELRFAYYDIKKDQLIDDPYYWFFAYLPNSEDANDMESYQKIVKPYLDFFTDENSGAIFKITGMRMKNESDYYSECENCGNPDPLHQIKIDKIEVYKESYK